MRLGIFGGSFDPIHLGHLIVAEYTKELMNLDKIIFVPVGNPSHRENSLSLWEHRLKMIELSIEDNSSFEVSTIEILSNKKNYTYDTLVELKKMYPNDEIFEIIGEDSADYLHRWKNYEELISLCKFIVYKRDGYNFISGNENIMVIDSPKINISATFIRNKVKNNKSIKYLVNDKVLEYIENNKLYK